MIFEVISEASINPINEIKKLFSKTGSPISMSLDACTCTGNCDGAFTP